MENQNQTQDSKATWMERLAMESWQAEMVISGVAIFGSFQLFDAVNRMVDWCYFNLPEGFMGLAYFLCFYFLIAVAVLAMSFLAHFVIRALWIAAIGLESVYPQGFRRENDSFSTHFMDQLIARFPSLSTFNHTLDRVASALLAYALSFVMIFVGIGIVLSVFLFLGYILAIFIEDDMAVNIVYWLIGLYVAVIYFNAILNTKGLRDKAWVQRIHFPLSLFVGSYFTANIFARPQIYFSYTIRTNLGTKRFWGLMIGLLLGVVFITIGMFSRTQIFALLSHSYLDYDERIDRLYSTNYADESQDYQLAYIRPQIPSATLHDPSALELFIPVPERESRKLFAACSEVAPKRGFSLNKLQASRQAFRAYRQACFQEQIIILLDGNPVDYVMKQYTNPHQNEPGLQYFFPGLQLEPGEHDLEIQHLAVDTDGNVKTDHIPFFYLPRGG